MLGYMLIYKVNVSQFQKDVDTFLDLDYKIIMFIHTSYPLETGNCFDMSIQYY